EKEQEEEEGGERKEETRIRGDEEGGRRKEEIQRDCQRRDNAAIPAPLRFKNEQSDRLNNGY
ncbi:MAG: hypothetical protein K2P88_17780, partial [Chitinophagaceae bacterium]|nr:hypothetical protein [Chitinophagaceae bacterium]